MTRMDCNEALDRALGTVPQEPERVRRARQRVTEHQAHYTLRPEMLEAVGWTGRAGYIGVSTYDRPNRKDGRR